MLGSDPSWDTAEEAEELPFELSEELPEEEGLPQAAVLTSRAAASSAASHVFVFLLASLR